MKFQLLVISIFLILAQSNAQYKNLVLEGGGTRGIAYAGAIKVLEDRKIVQQLDNVAGTSAGSIAAMMIAVGYNAAEIDSVMRSLKMQKFNDGRGGLVGKVKRFSKEFGVFKGNKLDEWLSSLIAYKTNNANLSFAQLHELKLMDKKYKDLYCTGTNISQQRIDIFSVQHTPNMLVKTAVHISCCIPLYFEPVVIDSSYKLIENPEKGVKYNYYVDGGMMSNYPINMFDTCINGTNPLVCGEVKFNSQTLGLKLERKKQIDNYSENNTNVAGFEIKNYKDYTFALTNLMMETLNRRYPNLENEKGRTIYINQGSITAKIKNISEIEKNQMFINGQEAVMLFFESKK